MVFFLTIRKIQNRCFPSLAYRPANPVMRCKRLRQCPNGLKPDRLSHTIPPGFMNTRPVRAVHSIGSLI